MYIYFISIFIISLYLSIIIKKHVRGNIILRILRISTYNLPYLFIFLIFEFPDIDIINLNDSLIILFSSIFLISMNFKNIIDANKKIIILMSPPVRVKNLISRFSEVSLVPLIEEFFYRGTIPISSNYINIILFICTSILLFNLAHYFGNKITRKTYYLKLTILSITLSLIYVISNNIIVVVFIHIIYNLPWFLTNLRMYFIQRRYANDIS